MLKKEIILQEQGYFWFGDEPIPKGDFAPESHLTGLLTISDDGVTRVELDGVLPPNRDPFERTQERKPRAMQGILKHSGEHVLLLDAVGDGGVLNSSRFSYERYLATMCLVGGDEFPHGGEVPVFSRFFIDLDGFEGWLRLGTLKAKRTSRSQVLKHKMVRDLVFKIPTGELAFIHRAEFHQNEGIGKHKVTLREWMTLRMTRGKAISAHEVKAEFLALQDLMILLTDSHRSLPWPRVQIKRTRRQHRLYVWRTTSTAEPPKYHEAPTNFPTLRAAFGDIYTRWITKRAEFGAGFTSFIATRRDVTLYAESQFSMLVQGLESFHRAKYGSSQANVLLKEKIDRILGQVALAKDRKWLAKRLELATEPSLEARLVQIGSALPFGFERTRLLAFTRTCAEFRNDLAHFAGDRERTQNSQYLLQLHRCATALGFVYQMTLLREIGIDDKSLLSWLNVGFRSAPLKSELASVGLLPNTINSSTDSDATSGGCDPQTPAP